MRFRTIEVPAYGPFTDLKIDLSHGEGDFHLFYGPNEAGKSSLLRCLRSFLFGIDVQTTDGFLHDYKKLSIIAEVEKKDGTSQTFKRRKGNKNTLLDGNDAPLLDTALLDYLGGVDRAYFESMFGMGSSELRNGAAELLRGDGRLGETLFSASLGGTPVDKVIRSLEDEAATLYKGRSNAKIRVARKLLDDLQKQAKESLMKPDLWEDAIKAIDDIEEALKNLGEKKSGLVNRRAWLERCRDALPIVGQIREVTQQLESLETVPQLRGTFAEELTKARDAWLASVGQLGPLQIVIGNLRNQLDGCELPPEILGEKSEIQRLHFGIGLYREQKQNQILKRLEAKQRQDRIASACLELEIDTPLADLESRRISQVKLLNSEQAATLVGDAEQALADAEKRIGNLESEIAELREENPGPAIDIPGLEDAVLRTKRFEELSHGMEVRVAKAVSEQRKLESFRSRLPGAPTDLKDLRTLEPPLKSTIEKYRDDFDSLARRADSLTQEKSKSAIRVGELNAEIERAKRNNDLPAAEDLGNARQRRDRGWSLVLQEWKKGNSTEEFVSGVPLESAYPEAVAAADHIADLLLKDADAVAQMEERRAQLRALNDTIGGIDNDLLQIENERRDLQKKWSELWGKCVIEPLSPREMAEWRATWDEFCRSWDSWQEESDRIEADKISVAEATATLQSVLPEQPGNLADLLSAAGAKIAVHNQAVGSLREIDRQIAAKEKAKEILTKELPGLRERQTSARDNWTSCCKELGLPIELKPQNGIQLLRSRAALFTEFDRWHEVSAEIESLEQSIFTFEEQVRDLVTRLGRNPLETETDLSSLWDACNKAESAAQRSSLLGIQAEEREVELELIQQEIKTAQELLGRLLAEASLESEDRVPNFVALFVVRKHASERLADLRVSLAGLSREHTLEEFVAKVEEEEGAGLMGELDVISTEILELETRIEGQRGELQDWTGKRRIMEAASDAAAQLSQQAELVAGSLLHDCERFAKLQLAISLLKSRIDRFREQNQGPFMEKAGQWFSEITGGDFKGVSTVFDEGDVPQIAGMRSAEGETIAVESMSEGTRDQLYLALRLAGLELHLTDNEPMPLILDDLLVQFDDRRSLCALRALAKFGKTSQILLFTHHEHLVSLAESTLGITGFKLHRLD